MLFPPLYSFQESASGDVTPPAAPTLANPSPGDGSIAITYTPPGADYASGQIEYDDGTTVTALPTTTAGTYTISGLVNRAVYRLTARAKDAAGNWSARSIVFFVTVGEAISQEDDGLEHFVCLSLQKVLGDAGIADLIQVPGFQLPPDEETEEWLTFTLLHCPRWNSRAGSWFGNAVFVVQCFARVAQELATRETNRPWRIASRVRSLFEKTNIEIKAYGEDEARLATLNVKEGSGAYQAPLIGQGCHSVLMTFTATLIKP